MSHNFTTSLNVKLKSVWTEIINRSSNLDTGTMFLTLPSIILFLCIIVEVFRHQTLDDKFLSSTRKFIKSIPSAEASWKSWKYKVCILQLHCIGNAYKIQLMLIGCDFLASAARSIFSFSVDKKHCLSLESCHIVHCYDMLYLLRENFCLFLWGFAWVLWNIMPWNLWLLGSVSVTAWATHVWATQAAAVVRVAASHYFSSADTAVSQTVIDIMGLSSSTTPLQSIVLLC